MLYPGFEPATFLDVVPRYRVNHTILVPTMIRMVLDHPAAATADLSILRGITCGGSPVSKELLLAARPGVRRRLPPHLRHGRDVLVRTRPAAGEPAPRGRRRRRPPARVGGQAPPPRRRRGRRRRRPTCAPGRHHRRRGAGAGRRRRPRLLPHGRRDGGRPSSGGWMHTGDLATVDGDGFITIVDRKKDIIISGGINVASREVEEVLLRHPDVAQAAVDRRARTRSGARPSTPSSSPAPGVDPDHRRHPRVLRDAAGQLQEAPHDRGARRAADQRYRQGPQARAEGVTRARARGRDLRRTRCTCLISCAIRPSAFPTEWP